MLSYCSPCIMEDKECQNLKNKTHLKPISNTRITNTTRCTFFLISECIFFFTFIYLFFIFYFILSLLCIFIQTDFGHFHLMLLHTSALQHLNGKYSTFYYITIILFFTLRFSMFVWNTLYFSPEVQSVRSLHVLPVFTWVIPGYSSFLPEIHSCRVRLIGNSYLPIGENVSVNCCLPLCVSLATCIRLWRPWAPSAGEVQWQVLHPKSSQTLDCAQVKYLLKKFKCPCVPRRTKLRSSLFGVLCCS